ncbi:TraR/DksA family transcriptional regulator [Treponema denticola]|uniref:TraR/DksA family transcriptional regulator n=1 Tax=Treponema denticola TaxID=158 RepID=UPI0020A5909F|nr:TraR/DksA family transcriptional regulator [Treponema denticola]UTD12063.1 TraR/DksA family transcriptional regulator [Treponema denticola]
MKKKFIEEMNEYLLKEREEILASLQKNDEEYEETLANSIPKDFADLASYSTDRDMLEFIGENNVKKLQKIDSALERIREGKYGKCITCKDHIPEDRLKALPYALKCIQCQAKSEKKMHS